MRARRGGIVRRLSQFLLLAALVSSISPAYGEELPTARLIWEREFHRPIFAVGVDEDCVRAQDGEIKGCMKWILFTWKLWLLDRDGRMAPEPLPGDVYPSSVSDNGKYFVTRRMEGQWWRAENGVDYMLYDWDGNLLWELSDIPSTAVVWKDGTAIFLRTKTGMHDALDARFIDTDGELHGRYDFGEHRSLRGSTVSLGERFCVIRARQFPPSRYEIIVLERSGRVVWKRGGIWRRFGREDLKSTGFTNGGAAVFDRGEAILVVDNDMYRYSAWEQPPGSTQVFVYDGTGTLIDSLLLSPTGPMYPLRTEDNLAFLSTRPSLGGASHFICYDLSAEEMRFFLEAPEARSFGRFDVDSESDLIAVAVHSYKEGDFIRVYDTQGHVKTWLPVTTHSREHFWFRLLGSTVLVAEGSKLRQYKIDME